MRFSHISLVSWRAPLIPDEIEAGACAVLDVLSKHIDRGAAVKLATILPLDLRRFWPAFIQTAARERQLG